MPTKPARRCQCGGTIKRGKCSKCGPKATGSYSQSYTRGDRNALYGADWRRARDAKLRRDPLCEPCRKRDRVVAADAVHHLRGFKGPNDPKRLEMSNLESVCDECHKAMTSNSDGKSEARR